ncbi:hypothetical protein BH10ACI2_BH10ACI2_19340 [soil metagenome]
MKTFIAAVFIFLLSFAAYSQVAVGEEVDYKCNCLGQVWVKAKVEAVRGNSVKVRFGNLDNQVATVAVDSGLIRMRPKPENPEVARIRYAFRDAAQKYLYTVRQFGQFYDPQLNPAGGPVRPEEWQKAMKDLAELDAVCRQYPGVTDAPNLQPGMMDERFSVWCKIAAARVQLEPKARAGMAKMLINMGYTEENLNFGFNEPDNPIRMETQELIWNRAKWRAEKTVWLKPKYAQYGTDVPPDAFDGVEKRADQLRAMVERDAPNRSWKQPKYHDAAVESFVKAKFASQFPGSQVVKIGLDYTTWVERKSLTYVASDETFNYYNVSYNAYKRGSVLLKIPGRPLCQMQEWVVGRGAKGLVAAGIGGSGTFMKCD